MTTYAARKVGLTPSQAVAIFEDRPHNPMQEAPARKRLDVLIANWRRERCAP
jgi:hypothetical protein